MRAKGRVCVPQRLGSQPDAVGVAGDRGRPWTGGAFGLAVAPSALLGRAAAIGDATRFSIAELDLGPGTVSRPLAWERLLNDVRATTSVETRDVQKAPILRLPPNDPRLFESPFVVCPGDGAFRVPDEEGLEQLARYLAYGGFLVFDDITGATGSAFDAATRRLAQVLFPTRPLAPLPCLSAVEASTTA